MTTMIAASLLLFLLCDTTTADAAVTTTEPSPTPQIHHHHHHHSEISLRNVHWDETVHDSSTPLGTAMGGDGEEEDDDDDDSHHDSCYSLTKTFKTKPRAMNPFVMGDYRYDAMKNPQDAADTAAGDTAAGVPGTIPTTTTTNHTHGPHDENSIGMASWTLQSTVDGGRRTRGVHAMPLMEESNDDAEDTTTNDMVHRHHFQVGFQLPPVAEPLVSSSSATMSSEQRLMLVTDSYRGENRCHDKKDNTENLPTRLQSHFRHERIELYTLDIAPHRRIILSLKSWQKENDDAANNAGASTAGASTTFLLYVYQGELQQVNEEPYWFPAGSLVELDPNTNGDNAVVRLETHGVGCQILVLLGQPVDPPTTSAEEQQLTHAQEESSSSSLSCGGENSAFEENASTNMLLQQCE
mmetsp:Transcript_12850/g.35576  ORF Transcript_12850/g.35576 Transcript_12850/m.35576 type:complete len:410 (+) Transcript_12850:157-1386(+)